MITSNKFIYGPLAEEMKMPAKKRPTRFANKSHCFTLQGCFGRKIGLNIKTQQQEWMIELLTLGTQSDVQADSEDKSGQTPLPHAAEGGHEAVVKPSPNRSDVQANLKDKSGQAPLSHAVRTEHGEVVKLLLTRSDVQANSRDKDGQSPLACAAENGHEAGVISRRV